MIFCIDLKRVEYGHVFVEASNQDEARRVVEDADFDPDIVVSEFNDMENDWEYDPCGGIHLLENSENFKSALT